MRPGNCLAPMREDRHKTNNPEGAWPCFRLTSGKLVDRNVTMTATLMNLKILLPFRVFEQKTGVLRIVAESTEGSFGLLPNRLDCVTALVPGILVFETEADGEVFVAVDEGILVKSGYEVSISVRQAIGGTDLALLRNSVQQEFLTLDQSERDVRSVMAKLETGFIHRFARLHHE